MSAIDVVQRYFKAMEAGPAEAPRLFELFADDATYIEPFTGQSRTHEGRAAIEACIKASWEDGPRDVGIEVNRIDVDGDVVRSEWTCTSPDFPAPVKGIDVCTVEGGLIKRLEVRFA